ncbi:cytochrome c maturation protein CcmE [Pseudemcibacter aquimaris]|uniref:cytochrome c maturation protein CcmE n=1 Tax=Pseudemcibacter aquimaris TaxID=2857064 RepID=UPI00201394F7|nr:cytochrome c maturation protein CcmE [Pseudemcibacter aquimaris]MCC3861953.1 cytochrome c maturation protein CcmE [Pseudemcibacter aquimaris]WDU58704.1 cytochrome c maturation protein CcmE [Pseudemcibacter aquimaris]
MSGPVNTRAQKRKKKRMYLVLTSMTILVLAVGLVLTALQDSISLFLDPTELKERNLDDGQRVRLGGLVAEDSFIKDADGLTYHFDITDGAETVSVVYKGSLPDLFREGQGVVVEGEVSNQGPFKATEVLAKHDENYMPKEVVDSLKKRGVFRHAEDEEV